MAKFKTYLDLKVERLSQKKTDLLSGFAVDSPKAGIQYDADSVAIKGWVLGKNSRAVTVKVSCGERVLAQTPVHNARPDVAKVHSKFPGAGKSGFATTVSLVGMPSNSELVIQAILEDGSCISLAKVSDDGTKKYPAHFQLAKTYESKKEPYILKNKGYCYTCDREVEFSSQKKWLRAGYKCSNCGSIPRERALMYCIEKFYPQWKQLSIHESSPANRGASIKLKNNCQEYQASQYFPEFPLGTDHSSGWRNEDLENQTFADESFDLVITQDVMEHLFNPDKAFAEIARTLKSGGAHIFTVPIVNKEKPSRVRARLDANGKINYLEEAQYHGNPVNPKGSLVTRDWSYDICDFIIKHSGLYTTIIYIDDISLGIRAEYIEVLISRKI